MLLILFSMIILQNLTLTTSRAAFTNSTQKIIKVTINNQLISSQPAGAKSATCMQWKQPMSLPFVPNAQYQFQIIDVYKFGYNPQDLVRVIGGKFTIEAQQAYASWQVFTDKKQKSGFLSANIRTRNKYVPIKAGPRVDQVLTISSIVAYMTTLKQKRGYIQVTIEGKTDKIYKTEISKSKSGQLLFTQNLQIPKNDDVSQAKVQVFSYDAKQQKSQLLGSGVLHMDPQKYQKKVIVTDQKGTQVGQLFIDHKILTKDAFDTSKQLSKIVHRVPPLNKSMDLDRRINQATRHSTVKGLSQTYGQQLIIPRTKPITYKKMSVVSYNNNIFTPTQQRFKSYEDKQTSIVSYLKEQTFDFKENHSKNYYRGASIGKGNKCDFTAQVKENPSVGVYKLPSIWDRY